MRIIQITPDFPPHCGGIGQYVFYLAKELQRRGNHVAVIFRGKQNRSYLYEDLPVQEIKVPGWPPLNLPIFKKNLEKLINKEDTDILHVHSSVMPVINCGIPVVVTGHCCNSEYIPTCYRPVRRLEHVYRNITLPIYNRIETRLSQSCDKMTVVSDSLRKQYERHHAVGAAVIYNGIDLKLFYPAENADKENAILFTGRLGVGKGLPDLLKIAQLLKKSNPVIKIYVIGSGPLGRFMNRQLIKMGLSNIIMIPNLPHEKLVGYYQRARLYVLPSYYEGFANSLLEAMACKLPVVATNIPSIQEQIDDKINGYLVNQGDISGFHEKISELLNNPEKCQQFGNAGRNKVLNRFTWKHVGDLVETQYQQVLGKK